MIREGIQLCGRQFLLRGLKQLPFLETDMPHQQLRKFRHGLRSAFGHKIPQFTMLPEGAPHQLTLSSPLQCRQQYLLFGLEMRLQFGSKTLTDILPLALRHF